MSIFRLKTLIPLSAAVLSGTALFYTAQHVQKAEKELARLDTAIQKERETLRVLESEWDYLNNPQRLEHLAKKHLDMNVLQSPLATKANVTLPVPPVPDLPVRKPSYIPPRKHTPIPATLPPSSTPAASAIPAADFSSAPSSPLQKPPQNFQSLLEHLTDEEATHEHP